LQEAALSNDEVYRIVYQSTAVRQMADEDLRSILASARANNQAHGVTGLLLYKPKTFLQVLEGPAKDVRAILKKIYLDERHIKIRTLFEEPRAKRVFADWSMAYMTVGEDGVSTLKGTGKFAQSPEMTGEAMESAKMLAGFFRGTADELTANR
jgi:hypothetical protein